MIDIVLCQDTYELICFELGMILDMTKLQFDFSLSDIDSLKQQTSRTVLEWIVYSMGCVTL